MGMVPVMMEMVTVFVALLADGQFVVSTMSCTSCGVRMMMMVSVDV